MYDPYKNTDGSDSELGQLSKTSRNPAQESRYQDLLRTSQQNDPNKAIQDQLNKNRADMDSRFTQNRQELTDFTGKYQSAIPQAYQQANDTYHVGDLLGATNALSQRIKTLQGNTDNSGAGGYANAGQVDRAINTRYLPNFNSASENLNRAGSLAQGMVDTTLSPYRTEASLLSDRLARESTGYSQQQQGELDVLLEKMRQQGTLDAGSMQRANELAMQEKQFQQQIQIQQMKNEALKSVGRYGVYDPTSGQIIGQGAGGSSGAGAGASSLDSLAATLGF